MDRQTLLLGLSLLSLSTACDADVDEASATGSPEVTQPSRRLASEERHDSRGAHHDWSVGPIASWGERHEMQPRVDSIAPALGDTLGGTKLTLTGRDLSAAARVEVGGLTCADLKQMNDSKATCVAPALPAGKHDVTVFRSSGDGRALKGGYEAWSPTLLAGARVYQADQRVALGSETSTFEYERRSAALGWSGPRDGAGLVDLDGTLFMIGGWNPYKLDAWGKAPTTNEVLRSSDGGRTWTTVLPHDADPPTTGPGARFRRAHTSGVFTHVQDGIKYIYVIGGDHLDSHFRPPNYSGEVWRSADGITWTRVGTNAPSHDRMLHMVASFNGAIYLMGGQHALDDPESAANDVWRSLDGGATWTRLPDAPWPKRAMVYSPVVHDGSLFVIAGGTYAGLAEGRTYFNDVWRMSAAGEWTEVLANGHTQFEPREYHNVVSYDGKLWVMGGYNTVHQNLDSVHYSSDGGLTWTEIEHAPWGPSHADGVVVTNEGIMRASGNSFDEAAHLLRTHRDARVEGWDDLGSDGKDLVQANEEAQPVFVEHDDMLGGSPGVVLLGAQTMQLKSADRAIAGGALEIYAIGANTSHATASEYSQWNPPSVLVGATSYSAYNQFGFNGGSLQFHEGSRGWHVTKAGSGLDDGAPRVFGAELTDGSLRLFVDEDQMGPTDPSVGFDATWTGWEGIGAGIETTSLARFHFGALVVRPSSSPISDDDRAKLVAWSMKWRAH